MGVASALRLRSNRQDTDNSSAAVVSVGEHTGMRVFSIAWRLYLPEVVVPDPRRHCQKAGIPEED